MLTSMACHDSLVLSMANFSNPRHPWTHRSLRLWHYANGMVQSKAAVAVVWSSILSERQLWLLALQSNQAIVLLRPSVWDIEYTLPCSWSNGNGWEGKTFH